MAADQGLIQASLKEALSRVGPDKTKFYESQVNIPLAASASIVSVFEKRNAEKKKSYDDIAGSVEKMQRQFAGGNPQLGGLNDFFKEKIKSVMEGHSAAWGNKEKEDEIKLKVERLVSEMNTIYGGLQKFGDAYANKELIINEDDTFYKTYQKIMDDTAKFSWDDKNGLLVGDKNQKMTDLFNELHLKDATSINNIGKLGAGLTKETIKNKKTWEQNSLIFKANVKKAIPDKSSYLNAVEDDTLTGVSFEESLFNLLDTDPENDDASLKMILGKNDAKKVYDTIINPSSENLENAKEIYSKWVTEGYGKAKFTEGKNARSVTSDPDDDGINDDDKGSSVNLGRDRLGVWLGWIPKIDIDNKIKEIDGASKVGTKVEHLRDSSIYAELIGGVLYSEKTFEIYVQGEKRKDGPFTIDQVKNIFKVGKTPQGR